MQTLGCLADWWVIQTSYRVACYGALAAAAFAFVIAAVEWRTRALLWSPFAAMLVLAHPGWRMWPDFRTSVSSDCGYGDRFVSAAIVLVLAALLAVRLLRPDFGRRRFLLLLAAACWILHLGAALLFRSPLVAIFPSRWTTESWFQETMITVDFGQAQVGTFTVVLTAICAALCFPWRRVAQQSAV